MRIAISIVALLIICAPVARADPAKDKRAKELFEQGIMQYRLAKFETALGTFEEALKLAYRLPIILNIAQCHRQLKHHQRALFYYKLYLTEWQRQKPDKTSPYEKDVRTKIAELKKLAGKAPEPRASPPAPGKPPAAVVSTGREPPSDRQQRRRTRTIIAYTALSVGAACAATAGVLLGLGKSQGDAAHGDYMDLTDPSALDNAWNDVESANNMIIAGWVLAGTAVAAAGVSLWAFLSRPSHEAPPDPAIPVSVVPTRGGALVGTVLTF